MELEEFIKNTLVSIANGLHGANEELNKEKGGESVRFAIEPFQREKAQGYISFDVAVTVSQETIKSGGGKIKIAIVNLGGEIDSAGVQEHVSRIKFNIIPQVYIS